MIENDEKEDSHNKIKSESAQKSKRSERKDKGNSI